MVVIYSVFSVCCILLLASCTTSNEENTTKIYDQKTGEGCKHCNVSFWVTKYARTHIEGPLERFKITADELTKKRRKGRMIEFINYDELYLKTLTINQSLNTKIVKFDMSEIALLTSSDDNLSADDTPRVDSNQIEKQTDAELLGNSLSRVLADEVTINFNPSQNPPIVLTANYAKMLTDTMTMQFEGNVTLEAAKCRISSEVAVWSNEHNGLFFSESFQLNNKTYAPPAFFQITDAGKCQRVRSVHDVEYIDKLDAIEDKMFESMPMPIQLLFGLMGSPSNL